MVENISFAVPNYSQVVPVMPNVRGPNGQAPIPPHKEEHSPKASQAYPDKDSSLMSSSRNNVIGDQVDADGQQGGSSRCPSQQRKIFIGGVPQDMTQAELYTFFGQYGKVKKAWLQKARAQGAPQSHRGFGFVIFDDTMVVDKLLGSGNFSLRLALPDKTSAPGCPTTVEIKRAMSTNSLKHSHGQSSITENGSREERRTRSNRENSQDKGFASRPYADMKALSKSH